MLENDLLGAGVVRARPPHNYAWRRQNFVASKNKKEKFQGSRHLKKGAFLVQD